MQKLLFISSFSGDVNFCLALFTWLIYSTLYLQIWQTILQIVTETDRLGLSLSLWYLYFTAFGSTRHGFGVLGFGWVYKILLHLSIFIGYKNEIITRPIFYKIHQLLKADFFCQWITLQSMHTSGAVVFKKVCEWILNTSLTIQSNVSFCMYHCQIILEANWLEETRIKIQIIILSLSCFFDVFATLDNVAFTIIRNFVVAGMNSFLNYSNGFVQSHKYYNFCSYSLEELYY